MTPLEMIAEWKKGCTVSLNDSPESCGFCTRALIDGIEAYLIADDQQKRKISTTNQVYIADNPPNVDVSVVKQVLASISRFRKEK